jgi:hypothetical protein
MTLRCYVGSGKQVLSTFSASAYVRSRRFITDAGNYPVWDSGIPEVIGEVGHGRRIRVRTRDGGKRTFSLRVRQIPGQLMTWTGRLPLGLLQVERAFTLTDYTGITHLRVKDTAHGPLRGLVRKTAPGSHPALSG